MPHPHGRATLSNAVIVRLSVHLSVCLSFQGYDYYRTLSGNPLLEFKPIFSVAVATGSGRNGNEAVAGAASEAFARWL